MNTASDFDRNSLKEFYTEVFKWDKIAGNNKKSDDEYITLYEDLVKEETKELIRGSENKDWREYVDGIVDSLWVISSLLQRMTDPGCVLDIPSVRRVSTDSEDKMLMSDLKVRLAVKEKTMSTYFEILEILEIMAVSWVYGIDPEFKEVVRSNFSKFTKPPAQGSHTEWAEGLCKEITELRGCGPVNYEWSEGYYVFRNAQGKIMKPPTFSAPVLFKSHYGD